MLVRKSAIIWQRPWSIRTILSVLSTCIRIAFWRALVWYVGNTWPWKYMVAYFSKSKSLMSSRSDSSSGAFSPSPKVNCSLDTCRSPNAFGACPSGSKLKYRIHIHYSLKLLSPLSSVRGEENLRGPIISSIIWGGTKLKGRNLFVTRICHGSIEKLWCRWPNGIFIFTGTRSSALEEVSKFGIYRTP